MTLSIQGFEFIKKWEGFRAKPYTDAAGVPTIGYGSTFYANGTKVTMNDKPISVQEAETLLKKVVKSFENAVNKLVTKSLTQSQFDALVSFCYNVGVGNFQKSTLLKLINQNPNDPNIYNEFLKHIRANGKILTGLQNRRKEEASLYGSKKKVLE